MASYIRAVSAEWLKLSKSKLWPQIFLCAILVMLLGILNGKPEELAPWEYLISIMIILHAMLLLPILTGIFSAMVCRYEHSGGDGSSCSSCRFHAAPSILRSSRW